MADSLNVAERVRYSRHLLLSEIGEEGQLKLRDARVLFVGAGGLGCPAMLYLAAAGVGTLGIVDSDLVEESNLQRQVLYDTSGIGKVKVEQARERLEKLNPHVDIRTYALRFVPENALRMVGEYDLVIDGSDNFATRYLVNDACVVGDRPFVSASILRFEGQLSLFNYCDSSGKRGATYRCLYPEPPDPDAVPSCSEIGVLGVVPGILGSFQAAEALKVILGIGETLSGKLLLFNALTMQSRIVSIPRNEKIVENTKLLSAEQYQFSCPAVYGEEVKELSPAELKRSLDHGEDVCLIDVREDFEREICHIGGTLVPPVKVLEYASSITRDKQVVFYCRNGVRSRRAVKQLQREFQFDNLYNLEGGILAWIGEIDPSLPRY